MRIDAPGRTQSPSNTSGTRRADGVGRGFSLDIAGASPARVGTPSAAAAAANIGALGAMLALQEFEDPRERRARGLKRGHDLLDRLEGLKIALLSGQLPEAELDALVANLATRLPTGDAKLESVLDDIDLRARVELAKVGRFPA